MLLCSSRLAYPSIHELMMTQLLQVIVIPAHCQDAIDEVMQVLKGSAVEIIIIKKEELEKNLLEVMSRHAIDLVFMISFAFKIPAAVYQFPAKGFYNAHPGPLPAYRGADPVFYQIKNREKRAGVCIHVVNDEFDSGDIVMQEMIRLHPTDTYGKLTSKLAVVAAQAVQLLIRLLIMGKEITGKKQDAGIAVYHKKQQADDVCINWANMTAADIVALVNAGNPWNKGAITKLNERIIRVVEADIIPGAISSERPGLVINTTHAGLETATINGDVLNIRQLYTDEGFYSGTSLQLIGIGKGFQFLNMGNDATW
jgi:methionyl-tRNA formyltransferase